MAEIDDFEVAKLAQGLRVSRGVFSTAYDVFAMGSNGKRFMQIAEEANQAAAMAPGLEKDTRDFNAALREARDKGWLVRFVFDKFAELSAGAPEPVREQLQGIVNRTQRFVSAKTVEAGTLAASRRCCQIVVVRQDVTGQKQTDALGSGFLIGPHLVLTNHHVVASLLGPDGMANPAGPRPMARFDYHEGARQPEGPEIVDTVPGWLRASSAAAPEGADAGILRGRLDYAVLELDGLPGHARGWYDLTHMRPPPAEGAVLEVWQFPWQQPMKVLPGPRAAAPTGLGFEAVAAGAVPPRIYYMVNTERGSSGGLVLDAAAKEPVALHDAGYVIPEPAPAQLLPNRGIPLALIAVDSASFVGQALREVPAKVGWHPARSVPIIGRAELQRLIFRAQHGKARIISILTHPDAAGQRVGRIGRSYTRFILEACLPAADHHVLEFSAGRIDPDPFLTAHRLVQAVDVALADRLPQPSGQTTLDADVTGMLVEGTVKALLAAAPNKTVWLMIDDIDAHPIGTQWGSATFLIALYRRAAVEPLLRVVLVGLPRELEGLADLAGPTDPVQVVERLEAAPDDKDLETWLQAHLTERNWPSEFAPRLGTLLGSVADERAAGEISRRLEEIAGLLKNHARRAFRPEAAGG